MMITFQLDNSIWGADFKIHTTFLDHELRNFAYLYKAVKFELTAIDAKNPEFQNVWEGHFRVEPATHRIELLSA